MVITEIDGITLNLDKKIIGRDERVSLQEIKKRDIPSFIKNYFDRESEKWIREESSMFLSSGRFNYDLPEIRKKFDELYNLLKNTAIFSRAKLHRVMEQAVKLQSNFLIQPQRTMVQFIYRDEDVITPAEVMDSMKYFLDYEYYYQALEQFFKNNKMETISRTKFKSFIQQLDEKALSQDKSGAALSMAQVIVGFLNLGRDQQSDNLDTEILISAYQDRNLPDFVNAMKNAQSKGKDKIPVSQLAGMLKSFVETGDIEPKIVKEAPKAAEVKYEEKKEVVSTKNLSNLVSQIEDIKEEDQAADVSSFFEEEEEDDIVLPAQPPMPEVKPTVKPAVPAAAAAGADTATQLAEHLARQMGQAEVLEDLNKLIEDKDKKLYIKKLFKKKDKEFFQLLANLNASTNWKDANNLIDDTFYALEVNPYQKEAIAFTDAVYARYFPKKD
ncbi:hypothetical protein F9K33_10585 [bacterium]|nr:MAG: hypothetical protein F9K33_10585 [bacterium]